ncbi:MAG: methyltransferase domain-containing protein [Gammaproteobacteria bacterium]
MLEAEEQLLTPVLAEIFGYYLVLLDPLQRQKSLDSSRVMHHFSQSLSRENYDGPLSLQSKNEQLAWQSDSIDAFVLPHTLEVATDPHQLLREIDRCLVPEGKLVILGFNPKSLWGIRQLFFSRRQSVPWSLPFISLSRARDWLSLLGYSFIHEKHYFPALPWEAMTSPASRRVLNKIHFRDWPFMAGCYLLVAQKRVSTFTPVKPRWRPRRSLVSTGLVEPSQRI